MGMLLYIIMIVISFALLILGILGLLRKKLSVSNTKEIRDRAVVYLSIFYIVFAILPYVIPLPDPAFFAYIAVLIIVTIYAISVSKQKQF